MCVAFCVNICFLSCCFADYSGADRERERTLLCCHIVSNRDGSHLAGI